MVERFEVGKWYRWIGPDKPRDWLIDSHSSSLWESGNAFRCSATGPLSDSKEYQEANFDGILSTNGNDIDWSYTLSAFEEVKP